MKKTCALILALLPALAAAAYVPNPTEKAVLEAILRAEIETFSEGGGTLIGEWMGTPAVQADVLSEAYAAGASAAAPMSLERPVLLSGTVAKVEGDAKAGQWIVFDSVMPPAVRARLPAQRAAARPGAEIALVCAKLEVAQGVPTMTSCQDAAAVAARKVAALRASLDGFHQGKPTNIRVSTLAINALISASLLPADHGCPDDMARCAEAVKATHHLAGREEALLATVHKLKAAGVDLSAYDTPRRPGRGR